MKNWKEHAHLFCNRKFYIDAEPLTSINGDVYEFDGFVGEIIGIKNDHNGEIIDHIQISPEDCTLIARKIEDMTDEEVKEMYSIPGNSVESLKQMRDFTEMKANNGNLKFSEAIYLLSIGVYPFDQSHFEDGTVLDINS